MTYLPEILGFLAGAFGLTIAIPQTLRIRKHGTAGVSPATWMLTYAAYASWLGYGLATSSPSQVVTNSIALLLGGWLLLALLAQKTWKWAYLLGIAAGAPAFIIFAPTAITSLVLLAFVTTTWPQIWRAAQAWRQHITIPGVSTLTWGLNLTSGALWFAYALLGERPVVATAATLNIVASLLILTFTHLANKDRQNVKN